MVNYNMGRYYAWANLKALIAGGLRKFVPAGPAYTYHYVPPTNTMRPVVLPFEQWKSSTPPKTQDGTASSPPTPSP